MEERHRHSPAVSAGGHQAAPRGDPIPQLGVEHGRQLPLEGVLQPPAVDHRGLPDEAHHRADGVQRIPLPADAAPQIGAADAEGVDLAIQFLEQAGGPLHVAVGSNAFKTDAFTEQLDLGRLVAA